MKTALTYFTAQGDVDPSGFHTPPLSSTIWLMAACEVPGTTVHAFGKTPTGDYEEVYVVTRRENGTVVQVREYRH